MNCCAAPIDANMRLVREADVGGPHEPRATACAADSVRAARDLAIRAAVLRQRWPTRADLCDRCGPRCTLPVLGARNRQRRQQRRKLRRLGPAVECDPRNARERVAAGIAIDTPAGRVRLDLAGRAGTTCRTAAVERPHHDEQHRERDEGSNGEVERRRQGQPNAITSAWVGARPTTPRPRRPARVARLPRRDSSAPPGASGT